jgi:hypothetical protein
MAVCLWAELGVEGREVCYQTETDEYGAYEFDGVEMATQHSYEATYWIGVNRTPESSTSINADYASCRSTVTVLRSGTRTWHAVIEYLDNGPVDPEAYIEN